MYTCKDIQKMMPEFEHNRLTLKQEEKFIKHLKECSDCREEFEINYIIKYGLEEDNIKEDTEDEYKKYIDAFDFKGLVDVKIKKSIEKCEKERKILRLDKTRQLLVDVIMIMTLAVGIIILYF